jgi:hypothetical protein
MKHQILAAGLMLAVIVGISALPIRDHNRNSKTCSLHKIQTDRATLFLAAAGSQDNLRYVERVPAMTGESKAFTKSLEVIAATL